MYLNTNHHRKKTSNWQQFNNKYLKSFCYKLDINLHFMYIAHLEARGIFTSIKIIIHHTLIKG